SSRVNLLARRHRPDRLLLDREPEAPRDDDPLDLRSPGVEPSTDRVAQRSLDAVLLHVEVAAVDLDGVECRLYGGLADVELHHRRFERGHAAFTLAPRASVQQEARGLEPELHVGELRGNELEASDRPPELVSGLGVLDADLELSLHRPDRACEEARAL